MAYKNIIGIGNALVDILTQIPDDHILDELNLQKGAMQHVDAATSSMIGEHLKQYGSAMEAGGSTANTVSGAAKLGIQAGYIGKVGLDLLGKFFEEEMEKTHVHPLMQTTETPTGCAQAIVSQDGERTFATYLGAALELEPSDLKPEMFDGWDILFLEGYLVFNRPLVDRALEIAHEKDMTVAIDMASFNVVEANRDYLQDIIAKYIDIVFANQEESRALTGQDDPEAALHTIASWCDIAVVKVGAKGSYVQQGNKVVRIEPIPAEVVDTTGAGDLWAAGFMAGLIMDKSIEQCARMGATLAANIIEVVGAKMDEKRWQKITNSLELS